MQHAELTINVAEWKSGSRESMLQTIGKEVDWALKERNSGVFVVSIEGDWPVRKSPLDSEST